MNHDIPPLKVLVHNRNLTQNSEAEGYEMGYAFAIQSWKGRALQFHVLFQSGAHFRHVPLHWLIHTLEPSQMYDLELLQLWDCFSFKPVVTVFDFLRDYSCNAILKDKQSVEAKYWFTIDWLPDVTSVLASCSTQTKTSVPTLSCWGPDNSPVCLQIGLRSKTPTLSVTNQTQEQKDTQLLTQFGPQRAVSDGQ